MPRVKTIKCELLAAFSGPLEGSGGAVTKFCDLRHRQYGNFTINVTHTDPPDLVIIHEGTGKSARVHMAELLQAAAAEIILQ